MGWEIHGCGMGLVFRELSSGVSRPAALPSLPSLLDSPSSLNEGWDVGCFEVELSL